MMARSLFSSLRRCRRGVMAIESVIVAPVLALFALGAFQVGSMVSRQQELQSAASDVEAIILAATQSDTAIDSTAIEDVVENSLDLDEDQVILAQRFRCGDGALAETVTCDPDVRRYEFVLVQLTDTYTPFWAEYGVGAPVTYTVNRTIQIQ